MYKSNSRDNSNVKGSCPHQLHRNLKVMSSTIGYYSYTDRCRECLPPRVKPPARGGLLFPLFPTTAIRYAAICFKTPRTIPIFNRTIRRKRSCTSDNQRLKAGATIIAKSDSATRLIRVAVVLHT